MEKLSWNTIISALALLITAFTTATVYGEMRGQVKQNTKDIAQMQTDKRADNLTLYEIDRRTARMEAKLEVLLPTAAVKELQK